MGKLFNKKSDDTDNNENVIVEGDDVKEKKNVFYAIGEGIGKAVKSPVTKVVAGVVTATGLVAAGYKAGKNSSKKSKNGQMENTEAPENNQAESDN